VLSQSILLRPYLKRSPELIKKNFIKHGSDEEFETAYVTINKISPGSEEMKRLPTVRGFYDDKKDTIHVRPRSDYGEALHEAIHKMANPGFRTIFGHRPVDEGVTQYFTDRVLEEQELPPAKTAYDLDCENNFLSVAGFDAAAKMYFQGDNDSRNALEKRLNISTEDFMKLSGNSPEWCQRFEKAVKASKQKK